MSLLCVIIIIWAIGYVLYYIGYCICVIITFGQMAIKAKDKRNDLKRIFKENEEFRARKIKESNHNI